MIIIAAGLVMIAVGCVPSNGLEDGSLITNTAAIDVLDVPARLRILRLDSYHPEYLWSQQIDAGIRAAFYESGLLWATIEFDHFYMDTKRQNDEDYFQEIAAEAINYIRTTSPDLVIASDNNAVRLVVVPLADEGIPFVFLGLNDDPATYGLENSDNVTGVLERAHFQETLNWVEYVFPDVESLSILLDDSVTTHAYLDELLDKLAETNYTDVVVTVEDDYQTWQSAAMAASSTSEVLIIGTYHVLRTAEGLPVHEDEVMPWLMENSVIPVIPLWEFSIPFGALGGAVISGETQGYEAGLLAMQILSGASPGSLPLVTPTRGKLVLNQAAIERWQVEIPLSLIEVSEIFRP